MQGDANAERRGADRGDGHAEDFPGFHDGLGEVARRIARVRPRHAYYRIASRARSYSISAGAMGDAALKTVRDLVRWGASEFGRARLHFGHGTDNALDEAFHLVTWALKLPHDIPGTYLDGAVTAAERKRVIGLLKQRIRTRRPAAYLTGEAWFAGLPFAVDERVLIPRSPIAELIDNRFRPWVAADPARILDLCAGSGCIGIACAVAFGQAQVDLAELDAGALAVMKQNVAHHALGDRVRVVKSDLFNALPGRRYDLVVCNPPYIPLKRWRKLPREYHHEPRRALAGGGDGLTLVDRILRRAPAHLNAGGVLVLEVGGTQPEFIAKYPELPVVWLEFERGGDGVFTISREELAKHVR
jgi:ribosomal protein L3 glutamine methyltransferase